MSSTESVPTRPNSVLRAFQSQVMSPTSDIVGPSPVTSNGTETTEIEDDEPAEPGREHNHFQPQVGKKLVYNGHTYLHAQLLLTGPPSS